MHIPTLNPAGTPLSPEQLRVFNQFVSMLTPEQASWVSGYLAGVQAALHAKSGGGSGPAAVTGHGPEVTVLVGSQTGNSDKVAEEFKSRAIARGLKVQVKSMGDYKFPQLKYEKRLVVVVSTHGEGDPPDNAKEFHEMLHSKRAPKLAGTKFSVLGLGDSSYTHFCKMGVDFDQQFEKLGAERITDRVDCDLDYEEKAAGWMEQVLTVLAADVPAGSGAQVAGPSVSGFASEGSGYGKKNPFHATVLENLILNGRGADKETRHIELSLEGSGLTYQPGDSLGVYPTNPPELVQGVLDQLGLQPDDAVTVGGETRSLQHALLHQLEITTLTRPMMKHYGALVASKKLAALVDEKNPDRFASYVYGRDVLDLVTEFPGKGIQAQEFVDTLRKIPPRLYSLASSLSAHPDEAHLTVSVVRYDSHHRRRLGLCTGYLAERVSDDAQVPVYVEHNKHFKLPQDPSTPLILIGPGTGVAPFRAFLEEREATGATGRSWLFFGEQHFLTDFYYQTEWQKFLKAGVLTRMDVAFSRDQDHKIYVQHRMQERAKEIFAWLEEGAAVYVCGDEKRMAHDVQQTLIDIVRGQGKLSAAKAEDYVKQLQRDHRYQRDVY